MQANSIDVNRKEGAGNSAPSHSSNLSLILNRTFSRTCADTGLSPR